MLNLHKSYVVASCKAWHREGFEALASQEQGDWLWVSTTEELLSVLAQTDPRYIFFLHWNWSVPREIWASYECVCFHMTDVPYGRGGSPLQNLILAGKTETKLTALQMVEEMDAGPVYTKCPLSLGGSAQEIYIRAGQASFEIIRWMAKTEPESFPQQGEVVRFRRRKPEQSRLPECGRAESIYDFIRMLDADGYPNAFLEYGNMRFSFTGAELKDSQISASVKITFEE